MITAEDLVTEAKYKDAIKCKNYARFVFFSNRLTLFRWRKEVDDLEYFRVVTKTRKKWLELKQI